MKFKTIVSNRNNIISAINLNDRIKRLLVYNTRDPFSLESTNSSGIIVSQNDVEEDLVGVNIFPYSFTNNILSDSKNFIFCHLYKGDLTNNVIGKNTLAIDICVSQENCMLNETQDRCTEIAYEIIQTIDGNSDIGTLGNCMVVDYQENRVSNDSPYIVLSILVDVPTSNVKKR